MIEKFEGGRNLWVAKDDLGKLPKLFGDVWEIHRMVEKKGVQFAEKRFVVEEY